MSDASASVRDPNCLFCRIIAREIEADLVHTSGQIVAFRDIAPRAPTHILIVPTRHIVDAAAITPEDGDVLAAMFGVAQQIAAAESIADRGYRLVLNVGDDAGNTVSHLHLHLLGGRTLEWPPG